jgi:hypothetical protein
MINDYSKFLLHVAEFQTTIRLNKFKSKLTFFNDLLILITIYIYRLATPIRVGSPTPIDGKGYPTGIYFNLFLAVRTAYIILNSIPFFFLFFYWDKFVFK